MKQNKTKGMVAHACDPNTWEAEAGESWVQGQPSLQKEFKASLSYMVRLCIKKKKKKTKNQGQEVKLSSTALS
jgi:hypothetical protein